MKLRRKIHRQVDLRTIFLYWEPNK